MKAPLLALGLLLPALLTAPARAEPPERAYAAAIAALAKGADNEAIDRLELMADQGVVHADASLARAAAYLARAEGSASRPGDLGRAAAALFPCVRRRAAFSSEISRCRICSSKSAPSSGSSAAS